MYIRPTIQSASDISRDPGRFSLAHERRNLNALRESPYSVAINHRVAEHYRANAGRRQHQLIDRNPCSLVGVRLDWRGLIKDSIGRFTHGAIGHDAAATAMDQGLAGTRQPGNQCLDGTKMIAARRIDY